MGKIIEIFSLALLLLATGVLCDEFHFDPDSEDSKVHLQDDLDGHIDKKVEEMNQEELQFHYFRQHDYDSNEKLDGIELMSKLYQNRVDKKVESHVRVSLSHDEITGKVDGFMETVDSNRDGFIDFPEYKKFLSHRS